MEVKDQDYGELAQMVRESISQIGVRVREIEKEAGFKARNSRPSLFWDVLCENLENILSSDRYRVFYLKCCSIWETPVIYDVRKKVIYSFMKKYKFEESICSLDKQPPFYVRLLTALNPMVKDGGYGQQKFSFWGDEKLSKEDVIKSLRQKCSEVLLEIPWDLVTHKLIVFSCERERVVYLYTYTVDSNRTLGKPQNWNDITQPSISEIVTLEEPINEKTTFVKLTPAALQRLQFPLHIIELKNSLKKEVCKDNI